MPIKKDSAAVSATLAFLRQHHPEVLRNREFELYSTLLSLACRLQDQGDGDGLFRIAEHLEAAFPDNPETYLVLAEASRLQFFPCLFATALNKFVETWPEHDHAEQARRQLQSGEQILAEAPDDTAIEIGALHERMRWHFHERRPAKAEELARKVLSDHPNDVPALNNLSLAVFSRSDLQEATRLAYRVLELDPENIHATANLVQFHMQRGEVRLAGEVAASLSRCPHTATGGCMKVAQALSLVGDDRGILEVWSAADRFARSEPEMQYLAGVAEARLGRWREAESLWRGALKLAPSHEGLRANLKNAALTADKRHSAWALSLGNWFDLGQIARLMPGLAKAGRRGGSRLLEKLPVLAALVPVLLDRGDPSGTELAVRLCLESERDELRIALRDFALSQRGTDRLRMQAAEAARDWRLLPSTPVKFWQGGQWTEVLLIGFTVNWECTGVLPEPGQTMLESGVEALHDGQLKQAERHFEEALKSHPDCPTLVNNLACVYSRTGREKQALELLSKLEQTNPNYPFVRTNSASQRILKKDFQGARDLLRPLLEEKSLHVSEFAALCRVHIELSKAERSTEGKLWEELWWQLEEQEPDAARYRPESLVRERWGRRSMAAV